MPEYLMIKFLLDIIHEKYYKFSSQTVESVLNFKQNSQTRKRLLWFFAHPSNLLFSSPSKASLKTEKAKRNIKKFPHSTLYQGL